MKPSRNTRRWMMKRFIFLLLAVAIISMAGTATAASVNGAVPVTAVILGSCSINTAGASIDFGSLDPILAPAVSATVVQPTITCTNAMNYTISDDTGLNEAVADTPPLRLVDTLTGLVFIDYTIGYTAAKVGTGAADAMDIAANIGAGAYTGYAADSYTDTITFTVTW
jgi:spore coat protein U-like protein